MYILPAKWTSFFLHVEAATVLLDTWPRQMNRHRSLFTDTVPRDHVVPHTVVAHTQADEVASVSARRHSACFWKVLLPWVLPAGFLWQQAHPQQEEAGYLKIPPAGLFLIVRTKAQKVENLIVMIPPPPTENATCSYSCQVGAFVATTSLETGWAGVSPQAKKTWWSWSSGSKCTKWDRSVHHLQSSQPLLVADGCYCFMVLWLSCFYFVNCLVRISKKRNYNLSR